MAISTDNKSVAVQTSTPRIVTHEFITDPLPLAEDPFIDMKYLVSHSGLSDKYFYSLIKRGIFPRPIKLGRSSRWRQSEYEKWLADREKQR